jgi:hypothetical protein
MIMCEIGIHKEPNESKRAVFVYQGVEQNRALSARIETDHRACVPKCDTWDMSLQQHCIALGFKNKTIYTPYVSPGSQISHIATIKGNIK